MTYETKSGKKRQNTLNAKKLKTQLDKIINFEIWRITAINSIEKRLKAKVYELCVITETEHYEIHHVNKLKNLKNKNILERATIVRRRKTMLVCKTYHIKIHHTKS